MPKRPNPKSSSKKDKEEKPTTKQRLTGKFAGSSSDSDDGSNQGSGGDDDDLDDWLVKDVSDISSDEDVPAANAKTAKSNKAHILSRFKQSSAAGTAVFDDLDLGDANIDNLLDDKLTMVDDDILQGATGNDLSAADDLDIENLFSGGFGSFDSLITNQNTKTSTTATTSKSDIINLDAFNIEFKTTANTTTNTSSAVQQINDMMEHDSDLADIYQDDILNPNGSSIPESELAAVAKISASSTAPTPKKQQPQQQEQNKNSTDILNNRQQDQKHGISIVGTVVDKNVEYAHETSTGVDLIVENQDVAELELLAAKAKDTAVNLTDLQQHGDNHMVYIYNIYEDPFVKDGRLYLFGRILVQKTDDELNNDKTNNKKNVPIKQETMVTKSICIVVERVERVMYFLPRKHPINGRGKADLQRIIGSDLNEVKQEIIQVLQDYDVEERKMKVVKKKYCFGRRVSPKRFNSPIIDKLEKDSGLITTTNNDNNMIDDGNNNNDDDFVDEVDVEASAAVIAQQKKAMQFDDSLIDPINIIPHETNYIEVRYPSLYRALPQDIKGTTFSHVFGTQTSRQENFILDRKLSGPCWVQIPKAMCQLSDAHQFSWCDFEMKLKDARHLTVYKSDTEKGLLDYPPPLFTAVSLSIKTALNLTTNNNWEKTIVMATLKFDRSLNVDISKTKDQQLRIYQNTWTVIAPPTAVPRMPFDFEEQRQKYIKTREKLDTNIQVAQGEMKLLQLLLHKLNSINPDIIVGHDLHGSMTDILVARMAHHKLGIQWSKLGRLKRQNIPKFGRGGAGRSLVDLGAGAGRLLCDTMLSSKEFYPSKQYTLDHLADHLLDLRLKVIDNTKVGDCFLATKTLMELLYVNVIEAEAQFKIMHQLDIIPLTKQLTNLCGNTWHSSLRTIRSERVEYLLLHHFQADGFIPPEPPTQRPTPFNTYGLDEEALIADAAAAAAKKKAKNTKKKTNTKKVMGDNDDDEGNDDDDNSNNNTHVTADDEVQQGDGYFEDNQLQDSDDEDNGIKTKTTTTTTTTTVSGGTDGKKKKGPSYSGGKVLEPKRGFYNDWVAVLDFNSLYPSIIREYNLCFSTTPHWKMDLENPQCDFERLVPSSDVNDGILPQVVAMLIRRRRAVRNLIKQTKDLKEIQQYNIKQLAFKLVANSLYGCLGFEHSRFFCRPIASTITYKGRLALDVAVAEAKSVGANIIYGDTDSIMVNTQKQTYKDAQAVAARLKNNINKNYQKLKIDEDAYFKNMLLIRKKKYAAMKFQHSEKYDQAKHAAWELTMSRPEKAADRRKFLLQVLPNCILDGTDKTIDSPEIVNNPDIMEMFYFKREVKGLDMVRRDWSNLCRSASDDILNILLRDVGRRDETIQQVKECLTNINNMMMNNELDLDYFVITKQLTRSLQNYADGAKLPHVAVAARMEKNGQHVRQGDVIEYVMTTTRQPGASKGQADRAVSKLDYTNYLKHIKQQEELARVFEANPANQGKTYEMQPYMDYPIDMALDLIFYKENQLLTPIQRLVEVMDEISISELAECLGLDTAKYALRERQQQKDSGYNNNDNNFGTNSSAQLQASKLVSDPFVDYQHLPPLYIPCPHCHVAFPFLGLYSYLPAKHRLAYDHLPPEQKRANVFLTMPFRMHTPQYVAKLNEAPHKTGFICPTPGCPGLFNNWVPKFMATPQQVQQYTRCPATVETIIAALCNAITRAVRDYIQRFEQHWLVYNNKELMNVTTNNNNNNNTNDKLTHYRSRELMIKGQQPVRLAVTQLDVWAFLNYLLCLFDYTKQRPIIQQECQTRVDFHLGQGTTYQELFNILQEKEKAGKSILGQTTNLNNKQNGNDSVTSRVEEVVALLKTQSTNKLAYFASSSSSSSMETHNINNNSNKNSGIKPTVDYPYFIPARLPKGQTMDDFPESHFEFDEKQYQQKIAVLQAIETGDNNTNSTTDNNNATTTEVDTNNTSSSTTAPSSSSQQQNKQSQIPQYMQLVANWPLADLTSALPDDIIYVCQRVTEHINNIIRHNDFCSLDLYDIFFGLD